MPAKPSNRSARSSSSRSASRSRAAAPRAKAVPPVRAADGRDIFQVLKDEHAEVEAMFEELEEACEEEKDPPRATFDRLCESLEAHAWAEEAVFYPALRSPEETRDATLEALVEHGSIKDLLGEVRGRPLGSDEWWAQVHVLHEYVSHHVKEEEGEMFKSAKKVLDKDRRRLLAPRFLEAKRRAPVSR